MNIDDIKKIKVNFMLTFDSFYTFLRICRGGVDVLLPIF